MTITLSPDLAAQLSARARAEGVTVEAYLERLIREDEEWHERTEEPVGENDPEFADIRASVMEGLEQAERGEGRPAEEVFTELRAKYGLPR